MYIEKCYGDNLELILRNLEKRDEGVQILHSIMKYLLENNFYWKDFAPRNILINENKIFFVDFERGLELQKNIDLKKYFRENVYEEYVAFLLPEERPLKLFQVFNLVDEENSNIDINDIKSTRVKAIAKKLNITQMTIKDYLKIIQMIINVEEPKKSGDNIVFPIVELEDIASTKGFEAYIDEILNRNNIRDGERDV